MSYFILASSVLLIANNVKCNDSPGFCYENDAKKTLFAEIGEDLDVPICLTGPSNVVVNPLVLQGNELVNKHNWRTYVRRGRNNTINVHVVIDDISNNDFGEYIVIVSSGPDNADAPRSHLRIRHTSKKRLCQGQEDVMKVVAGLGTSPVLTFCVEALMRSPNLPILKVFDRWIRPYDHGYDKVNFSYVSDTKTGGRHSISVSFNNITSEDYQYVTLILLTGFQEEIKILARIKPKETCREIFRVDAKDGSDFLLLCFTDCFPRFMGIRRKQDDFYINEWNTTTSRMSYTLKATPMYFTCMDQAKYVCAITYLDGSSVMKETEVVLPGCPRNHSSDDV
ncbi:unnamed protein product [Lymnaea stagnalis]|uniref:Uncharacterized protein n=1 Tax=Lymnaea stagnalis TaxID=6523 RepID=A0AAV2HVS2_LYMST